jgi:hypothetical protein
MTLQYLQENVRAVNPRHITRDRDCCDWVIDGKEIMHERDHFPWSPFKQPTFHYWTHVDYKDLNLAKRDAERLGGVVEMHFYCDENDPCWFLIFDDMDNALKHCLEHL